MIDACNGRPTASLRTHAELTIGNIVRRVLHMIREEAQQVRSRVRVCRVYVHACVRVCSVACMRVC